MVCKGKQPKPFLGETLAQLNMVAWIPFVYN